MPPGCGSFVHAGEGDRPGSKELGITRQTLYGNVSPAGELRADGLKLLTKGKNHDRPIPVVKANLLNTAAQCPPITTYVYLHDGEGIAVARFHCRRDRRRHPVRLGRNDGVMLLRTSGRLS